MVLSSLTIKKIDFTESNQQIRMSADFAMTEHITRFTGICVAFCILLVFNVFSESNLFILNKFLVCVIINIFISIIPILIIWKGNEEILQDYSVNNETVQSEIGGYLQTQELGTRHMIFFAMKRRHADLVNVWCSKHHYYKKHYIITMTSVTILILRILFDPQQFICYDIIVNNWMECN